MQTYYINVKDKAIDYKALARAAGIVKAGGLAAFPTETVYGLGASAFNREAVLRLYEVKKRPRSQPFLLHISSMGQLSGIVELDDDARALAARFWPGPLSMVVAGAVGVAPEMLDAESRIGLRFPSHPVCRAFIDLTGPLAATSANLHGAESPASCLPVRSELDGVIDVIVAADTGVAGIESAIIDLSIQPYRVIRSGELDWDEVETVLPGKLIQKG